MHAAPAGQVPGHDWNAAHEPMVPVHTEEQ